jgi:hypothetical protein
MGWAALKSVELTDDEKVDHLMKVSGAPEPPDYPAGLQFSISDDDLERAGIDAKPGDSGRFSAMCEVTSTYETADDCRIELLMKQFAGEDGKLFDLSEPSHLCLCAPELEKLGLEADCEPGDMLHLIGVARMESSSNTALSGERATLQVIELTYEDESEEAREAER